MTFGILEYLTLMFSMAVMGYVWKHSDQIVNAIHGWVKMIWLLIWARLPKIRTRQMVERERLRRATREMFEEERSAVLHE
jgi:uncharacterized membrane protein